MIMHFQRNVHHMLERVMKWWWCCCLMVSATGLAAQHVHCLTVEGQGVGGALGPVKGALVRWPGGTTTTNSKCGGTFFR